MLTIFGSHGTFVVDADGYRVKDDRSVVTCHDECCAPQHPYKNITRIDITRYRREHPYGSNDTVDILEVGAFCGDQYEPPEEEHMKAIYGGSVVF